MDISVVIPTWNRAELITRAIESVLQQTYSVQELIVVDDGSTDDTAHIVRTLIEGNITNVSIVYQHIVHSGMPGKTRNYGIQNARHKWIALLDSDDVWLPTKIEKQVACIDAYNTLWCHTRERWIRNGKEISQKSQHHNRSGMVFEDALKKCMIGPSTVLLHSSLFDVYGLFREDLEIAEDYEMWLRICHKEPIGYVDEALIIKYAGHQGQLSAKYDFIEKFRIAGLQSLLEKQTFGNSDKLHTSMAIKELMYKQYIWEQGAKKRLLQPKG